MVSKGISILIFAVVAVIAFNLYQGVSTTSNQSGWSSMMIQATNNWIPLLLVAVVVITILLGISFTKKS